MQDVSMAEERDFLERVIKLCKDDYNDVLEVEQWVDDVAAERFTNLSSMAQQLKQSKESK